ncbi:hypothetical protein NKI96_24285 [Mesorhizobium sp. M0292]|uniref:hypothetical protein n=1 Tax=Mesorhizobium sp. M0292 TaxID=2956929 RepID=UPI00333CFCEF
MAAPRQSFLDTWIFPQVFYIALTVGGCVFIAVTKTAGISPAISSTVPIGIMIGYFAFSWYVGKLRLHDEQTGDNLYYMGFLFTLSSLGTSLYQFGTDASTDEIVRNFGIAVTSTITGIALRIFHNQVRRDPADVERAARHELADMTRRVRTEMESVAREFADFRRVCNQMLEEGFEEIARQAEKNGDQVRQAFEGMAAKAIKPVQETSEKIAKSLDDTFGRIESRFSGVAEKVDTVAASLDTANASMAGTVSKFEAQADIVAGKLAKVVIPDEVLKTDVVTVLKVLAASVGRFTERAEALSKEQGERTDKLSDTVLRMAAHQKLLLEKLEKQTEQNASTTNLLLRVLDRDRVPVPHEIAPVAPGPASEPSAETSIFIPISEVAAQGRQIDAEATFQANGTDAGPHPDEAPEPVVEKAQSRARWWR